MRYLLLALLFLCGCSDSNKKMSWKEELFRDLLIEHAGIYTLFGSKPMTSMPIHLYTPEEVQRWIDELPDEEKRLTTFSPNAAWENWEKWEKAKIHYPHPAFLLYRKVDPLDPKLAELFLVNITLTATTLEENYELLKRITHLDFEPTKEVMRLETGSPFWDKALQSPITWGLLYGYGRTNSLAYAWVDAKRNHKQIFQSLRPIKSKKTTTPYPLPQFTSYQTLDPILAKYESERAQIQKLYRGKDFLSLSLKQLTR